MQKHRLTESTQSALEALSKALKIAEESLALGREDLAKSAMTLATQLTKAHPALAKSLADAIARAKAKQETGSKGHFAKFKGVWYPVLQIQDTGERPQHGGGNTYVLEGHPKPVHQSEIEDYSTEPVEKSKHVPSDQHEKEITPCVSTVLQNKSAHGTLMEKGLLDQNDVSELKASYKALRAHAKELHSGTHTVLNSQTTPPLSTTSFGASPEKKSTLKKAGQTGLAAFSANRHDLTKAIDPKKSTTSLKDNSGNLIPVYHGSPKSFHEFKPSTEGYFGKGIYFTTDPKDANNYTFDERSSDPVEAAYKHPDPSEIHKIIQQHGGKVSKTPSPTWWVHDALNTTKNRDGARDALAGLERDRQLNSGEATPNIKKVFLNIKRPFDVHNPDHVNRVGELVGAPTKYVHDASAHNDGYDHLRDHTDADTLTTGIQKAGFDGIVKRQKGGHSHYVAFKPTQVTYPFDPTTHRRINKSVTSLKDPNVPQAAHDHVQTHSNGAFTLRKDKKKFILRHNESGKDYPVERATFQGVLNSLKAAQEAHDGLNKAEDEHGMTKYDLGNGYSLHHRDWTEPGMASTGQWGNKRHYWELHNAGKVVGKVLVDRAEVHDAEHDGMHVSHSHINPTHRGKGLGQSIYRTLADHYGGLASDPGKTSASAKRVWSKIGGQPLKRQTMYGKTRFSVAGDPTKPPILWTKDLKKSQRLWKSESNRVACLAVKAGDKLLMMKRADNGKWTSPGGHIENGENFGLGARREFREETGIQGPVRFQRTEFETKTPSGKTVRAYLVHLDKMPDHVTNKNDPDKEASEFKWFSITSALPKAVLENLHVPAEHNLILKMFPEMKGSERLNKAEDEHGMTKYDLGNGYSLHHSAYDYPSDEGLAHIGKKEFVGDSPETHYWIIHKGHEPVGQFRLTQTKHPVTKEPTMQVDIAGLKEEHQGKGIGKAAYKTLASHYGGLTSSKEDTSTDARRVWNGIGKPIVRPSGRRIMTDDKEGPRMERGGDANRPPISWTKDLKKAEDEHGMTKYDLGGGYSLRHQGSDTPAPGDTGAVGDYWLIHHPAAPDWHVGRVTVATDGKIKGSAVTKNGRPSIRDVRISPLHRGQGLGQKVYKVLSAHYGGIRSDPTGQTSPDAERVWSKVGEPTKQGKAKFVRKEAKDNSVVWEKDLKKAEQAYHGEHTAPDATSGKPLHDLKDIYPDDFYGPNATRYYGDGHTDASHSIGIMHSVKQRPKASVKIYRAVPHEPSNQEQIDFHEAGKKHVLKTGKPPSEFAHMSRSDYYDHADSEIQRLSALPQEEPKKLDINKGDWVTGSRRYAQEHGHSALNGKFKIISKTVPAAHLFTDGNSVHEWGYDPGETKRNVNKSVGQVTFPKLDPKLSTRPDQQIKPFTEANRGVHKKRFEAAGAGSAQADMLTDILSQEGPRGFVGVSDNSVVGSMSTNESEMTKHHEGYHYLMGQISVNHGPAVHQKVQAHLNSMISPESKKHLVRALSTRGYTDPADHTHEMIPAMRDILTTPSERAKLLKHLSPSEQQAAMTSLKRDWHHIRTVAKQLTKENLK